jgi:cell division protein FtsI/penicillin-binding protein 2
MAMRIRRKLRLKSTSAPHYTTWREYQDWLKQKQKPASGRRWLLASIAAVVLLTGAVLTLGNLSPSADSREALAPPAGRILADDLLISKNDVHILLEHASGSNLLTKQIDLPFKSQPIHIETSLDPDLQSRLIESMDRKHSRFIGIVVMQAETGRIQALAGFNKVDPDHNPCLLNTFPAASIFKIVTAAAAVDQCGFGANTRVRFNGYKHTLYKRQLKERTNRYTNTVSFEDSFAQSVNPVFGKLGALYLDRAELQKYAAAFGFNQPVDFELPVEPSHIRIEDDAYQRAEIASGFNNDTKISPLHAAMMASAVLNKGRMILPTIVDRVTDDNGRLLYDVQPQWRGRAMSSKASKVLARLMETTIRSGTGRKAFRSRRRSKVLEKLDIGCKTGSIDNLSHEVRFDWFVGFAKERSGSEGLIVAVLVAHEQYIGIRAAQYAKMAMTHYFENKFAQRTTGRRSSSQCSIIKDGERSKKRDES